MPIHPEKPKARRIEDVETTVAHPATRVRMEEPAIPRRIPMIPPNSDKVSASTTNCKRISNVFAPMLSNFRLLQCDTMIKTIR